MKKYDRIRVEGDGAVRTLVLDRPDALNALDREMLAQIDDALETLAADPEARVLIVTGSGRAFCAGADIAEENPLSLGVDDAWSVAAQRAVIKLHRTGIPTIAAINGLAVGAGLDISAACDLRIAAAGTWVAEGHIDIAYSPVSGGSYLLPRLVGPARAAEMILTARRVPVEIALEWGLVSEVVPGDEVLSRAIELANTIAAKPFVAAGMAKRLLAANAGESVEDALRNELMAARVCGATQDVKEATVAWSERRDPVFLGR